LNFKDVIFELSNQIKKLWCCRHLTIMNFTHCTNALRWYLYTIMIQNKFESWISVIHLLFAHKNSDILKKALQQLKTWCIRRWNLHYILTDDSAAEQATVKKAFLELKAEKQKVNHLLCRVHSNCTLQRYIKDGVIWLWVQGWTEFMSTISSKGVKNLIKKYKTLKSLKVDNSEVD